MKKQYETPVVEKIEFDYDVQVVASGCQVMNVVSHGVCECGGQKMGINDGY